MTVGAKRIVDRCRLAPRGFVGLCDGLSETAVQLRTLWTFTLLRECARHWFHSIHVATLDRHTHVVVGRVDRAAGSARANDISKSGP